MSWPIPHSKPTVDTRQAREAFKTVKSGFLSQGERVKEFEGQFARFHKVRRAAAASSGTAALHLALLALGIKQGDEVIIPSYVCTALLHAVDYTGARAKVVDVNYEDGNVSVEAVKKNINKKTKAVIVPHMFGLPADIRALQALGVPLIEDCAHSVGATYDKKPVGSFGVMSIFSFYATKMMTTGEGGMVLSDNRRLINKVKDLREYDHKPSYQLCFNYKMTDVQAAMGLVQLSQLPSWINKRKEIAARYTKSLADSGLGLPVPAAGQDHIFFRYVIRVKRQKDNFIKTLKSKGIDCAAPVFKPLHRYVKCPWCPAAEGLMRESVSIPIYPSLTNSEVQYIIRQISNHKN